MDLVIVIYLIEVLCGITDGGFSFLVALFLIFAGGGYSIVRIYLATEDVGEDEAIKLNGFLAALKTPLVISLVMVMSSQLIPSKDAAYKMIAAYAGSELIQMEGTKEVGSKAYKALNKVLDEYLDEGEEK